VGEIIRKTKQGKFVGWYLRYIDADGKRKQRASRQPSHAEARRMLIEIEARVARGMVGIEERRPELALTVEELFTRFTTECHNPRCKNITAYRRKCSMELRRVNCEASQFARLNISAVTSTHVAKAREALLLRYPAGTVRTTMIALSAAFTWAVREELIEKNPVSGVQRPATPPSRLDFLSADEARKLLDEAERRARTTCTVRDLMWWSRWVAISIGIHTGARKGEIFGLKWSEVDLEGRRLTISRSYATTPKNGKRRHLRLPSALVPLLHEWRERCPSAQYVCPVFLPGQRRWTMANSSDREHGLPGLLRAAGCRPLPRPWHLLRHTFASHFMQSGGNLLALSQILGHNDGKVTMVYAHLSPEYMAEQIDRVKF
jgi:integrase